VEVLPDRTERHHLQQNPVTGQVADLAQEAAATEVAEVVTEAVDHPIPVVVPEVQEAQVVQVVEAVVPVPHHQVEDNLTTIHFEITQIYLP